jgi:hypothetical protein
MTEKKLLLSWNELDIIKAQMQYLREIGERRELDDDDLFDYVATDGDLFRWEWESLCGYLTELIEKRNPNGEWSAEVSGLGWRGLSGQMNFQVSTGEDLLQIILPKTDCTFRIYDDGEGGLVIQNFHHDAPTGREMYYIHPLSGESDDDT